MITLRPAHSDLRSMFALHLHESLYRGLVEQAGLRRASMLLPDNDAMLLEVWAQHGCDNPDGQRAALARAIAWLIRVGDGVVVELPPSYGASGFWESVG